MDYPYEKDNTDFGVYVCVCAAAYYQEGNMKMKAINRIKHRIILTISNYRYICIFSIVIIALSISGYW